MFGLRLIIILAIVGGLIAFIGDKLGSKIGKKKLSVFGLRPYYTSVLMTVITGVLIAATTIIVMAISSDSARTAMFGMEKLQDELRSLNKEKAAASLEVEKVRADLADSNREIKELDAEKAQLANEVSTSREELGRARMEVNSLTESKATLEKEVSSLEETTERLRRGIVAMREGDVVYRSGEVIYAGVLSSKLNNEENAKQMEMFLNAANEAAMQRMGIRSEEPVGVLWLPNELAQAAMKEIQAADGNVFVRLRAVANIIAGEPAVCTIELVHNECVYKDNEMIYSKVIDVTGIKYGLDREILTFLNEVNHTAVRAGVMPDPLTGKVGNLDAGTMVQTGEKMAELGGKVVLKAYARGDIYTSGPVLLRLEVEDAKE
mgnify:FL=1